MDAYLQGAESLGGGAEHVAIRPQVALECHRWPTLFNAPSFRLDTGASNRFPGQTMIGAPHGT